MIKFKNKEKLQLFLLCLVSSTIPFLVNIGNASIILAIVVNIIVFQKKNLHKLKSFKAYFLVLFFFITVVSSIMSKKTIEGFKHLDLDLLLVLIVIIMINSTINKNVLYKILKYFYLSTLFFTLILLVHALIRVFGGANFDSVTFHGFTVLYDQHPVYFSMYLSLALFFSISSSKIIKERENIKIKWIYIFNLFLIIGLVLSASKAVLVIDLIAFSFFYLKTKDLKTKFGYVFSFLLLLILVFNVSFVKKRFSEGMVFREEIASFKPTNNYVKKKIFTSDEKRNISDLELRYVFGSIAFYHVIQDQKLLFGYGQGDVRDYLNYYYYSYNLGPNWYENRNVHNQYLHILIVYGLFVLIFFLGYIIYSFRKAIKYKNKLHLFFLVLTCFVFIFEVVLVRNKGIIFFYFFNSLFLFNYKTIESSNIRN